VTTATNIVLTIVYWALNIFVLVMWARLIFDLITGFVRSFRPRGAVLVIAELAYTITDPPIKLVRRAVPPLRFGGIALDLAWTIVVLVALILIYVTVGFMN
jgi:YggT family protein